MKSNFIRLILILLFYFKPLSLFAIPFGGTNSKNWTTEVWLANVAVGELSKSEANPNIKDVLLTLPVQMLQSNIFPFGDGQSNSHLIYGKSWLARSPIVVLKREIFKNGRIKDSVIWNPSLGLSSDISTLDFGMSGKWIYFKPKTWTSWFIGTFSIEIYNIAVAAQSFPALNSSNRFPDPQKINLDFGVNGIQKIINHKWSGGYNSNPIYEPIVHGIFPIIDKNNHTQMIPTAVGGVKTWMINRSSNIRYKHLYTCFDARNLNAESQTGTPSGAGWHLIGDPAETILNTIESRSLPVAVATLYSGPTPPMGQFAFELNHIVTIKNLRPGEMFLTRRGNMHWYVNPSETPFCNEIVVHNCEPNLNNSWGINCN